MLNFSWKGLKADLIARLDAHYNKIREEQQAGAVAAEQAPQVHIPDPQMHLQQEQMPSPSQQATISPSQQSQMFPQEQQQLQQQVDVVPQPAQQQDMITPEEAPFPVSFKSKCGPHMGDISFNAFKLIVGVFII